MNGWKNQLKNLIKDPDELKSFINISEEEILSMKEVIDTYKMSITPYYASLMDKENVNCPIRKMVLPSIAEIRDNKSRPNLEKEYEYEKITGLRQEFNGKVTILVTYCCPNYCRYCFRKYWVGKTNKTLSDCEIDDIIEYLLSDATINEVCISGGEPFVLSDEFYASFLRRLSEIQHIKVVRVFTKSLVFMPQRITDNLVNSLKNFPALYICTHYNHPKEITEESIHACKKLTNNGIPILNQTVLLKGINDNEETLRKLFWELVQIKVKPFYLYHSVKTMGNDYLVTPVETGTDIIKRLYGHMSALAIPLYTVPLYDGKALAMPSYDETEQNGRKYFNSQTGDKYYWDELEGAGQDV